MSDKLTLRVPKGVFAPTGTTTTLVKAVKSYARKPGKTLDLGCGCGVVGIELYKAGLVKSKICASDLSPEAVEAAKENAASHNCPMDARAGSLFEPWKGEKFDYIVDDVSGVAEEAARISPWFKGVPCRSGPDGASLVLEIMERAGGYLNKGGVFFFPVVSFSNVKKIVKGARENFSNVKKITHEEWPLPKEMYKSVPILKRLKEKGCADFTEKFGMILWYTDVYAAY